MLCSGWDVGPSSPRATVWFDPRPAQGHRHWRRSMPHGSNVAVPGQAQPPRTPQGHGVLSAHARTQPHSGRTLHAHLQHTNCTMLPPSARHRHSKFMDLCRYILGIFIVAGDCAPLLGMLSTSSLSAAHTLCTHAPRIVTALCTHADYTILPQRLHCARTATALCTHCGR